MTTAIAVRSDTRVQPRRSTVLRRDVSAVTLDGVACDVQLAKEADELLGYDRLLNDMVGAQPDRHGVIQILAELGIRPFSESSVAEYKATKVQAIERMAGKIERLYAFLLVLSIVVVAVGILVTAFYATLFITSWTGIGLVVGGGLFIRIVNDYAGRAITRVGKWVGVSLRGYNRRVPEFALQTACLVQQRNITGARLEVEEFLIDSVPKDPFLVLVTKTKNGEYRYYLEVWDEAEYEAKREI